MPRPRCCRRVGVAPQCGLFKPAGVPASSLEEVVLGLDEMEALRLADLLGMYQEQAAQAMSISRQTFGRIVETARKKVAGALINGKALRIEGGDITMTQMRRFQCYDCQHAWELAFGTGRPAQCPQCQSQNIHRSAEDRGCGRGQRGQFGRCHRGGRGVGGRQGASTQS